MKAHIITIGDEILIGQIVDTNSAWIASRLSDQGFTISKILTIGDRKQQILDAVGESFRCADLTMITGGLGPTNDDITKETLAQYFGCGMSLHHPTYEAVEKRLRERGVRFNELNRSQAVLPDSCTVLPNPNGTAPGMWFEKEGKILVSLPGVPFEMEELMKCEVLPALRKHFGAGTTVHKTLVTYGLPESELAETISGWEESLPDNIRLAYLPGASDIKLRLSAYGLDSREASCQIESRFGKLKEIIPANIIGYGDATLESCVAQMLRDSGKTLAVAESCTGGYISSLFTALAGASDYFLFGAVAYSNSSKCRVLNVSPEDIENYGAVSRQVARAMAEGARAVSGADYSIATTGIAGPGGGSAEKPIGTVWIAVSTPVSTVCRKFTFGKLRSQNIRRAAANALNMLRLILLEQA